MEYIIVDFIFLLFWITYCLQNKFFGPLFRGVVSAIIIYRIDALGWFENPIVGSDNDQQRIREYVFSNSTYEWKRSFPHPYYDFSNEYVMMKHASDFMMTVSYGIVWFTWETIMFRRSIPNKDKVIASLICFLGYLVMEPISWSLHGLIGRSVFTVRHMLSETDMRERAVFIGYGLLFIFNMIRTKSIKSTLNIMFFCFCIGCFQAFSMVLPLYLYGIRNDNSSFWYEVIYLINQGTPFNYVLVSSIGIINYYLFESIVPIWMRVLRPIFNHCMEPPTEERIVKYFDPQNDNEKKHLQKVTKEFFELKPKPFTTWYYSFQREIPYTVYQKVTAYYDQHIETLSHKKFNFIVILGLPRSGTTFVQSELMKNNPKWKGMKLYELFDPIDEDNERKGKFGIMFLKYFWPGYYKTLCDIHPYVHDNYEEETILFRACMRWNTTDSYNPDAEIGYIYLMKVLKILFNDGDTILLKSPYHALYPSLVNKYFKNGKVIVLERDFKKVEPSWTKLQMCVNSMEHPLAEHPEDIYKEGITKLLPKQLKAMKDGTKQIIETHPSARVFKSEDIFANPEKQIDAISAYVASS